CRNQRIRLFRTWSLSFERASPRHVRERSDFRQVPNVTSHGAELGGNPQPANVNPNAFPSKARWVYATSRANGGGHFSVLIGGKEPLHQRESKIQRGARATRGDDVPVDDDACGGDDIGQFG